MKKVTIVGIGPGKYEQMTIEAVQCLKNCDLIVGYTVYVDLIKDSFPDKKIIMTPMKQEVERCTIALQEANKGFNVAMVCSGDGVVYGMAGLVYELSLGYEDVEIEVVSGVTAALSGGAVIGAPLTHDFAVISLSDLLTPWETIEKRIRGAAMGDFAMAIYNPSSKKRADYLEKACKVILEYQSPSLICGYVKNIGREGETFQVLTLEELQMTSVDMFTTVFIGNSQTKRIRGKMITPRGYRYEQ